MVEPTFCTLLIEKDPAGNSALLRVEAPPLLVASVRKSSVRVEVLQGSVDIPTLARRRTG